MEIIMPDAPIIQACQQNKKYVIVDYHQGDINFVQP